MQQKFTDLFLKKLKSDGRPRMEVWDGQIPGFGMRVTKAGTKTFILVYRHRGRPRRMTLGRYPFMSLADARRAATDALTEVGKGNDPAIPEHAADDPAFRFDAVVKSYVQRHCMVHNKPSTAKETGRLLRKHFVSAWGKRDIRDIRQSDINTILDALVVAGKPSEANHALGVIKTLFRWCVDREMLAVSPSMNVKKPAKHGSRSRVLAPGELCDVWNAAAAEGYPFGTMTKLLILTGQRRGEVTQMRWPQIDTESKTWLIPAELSKNGREHLLPLSARAMEIISAVPRLHDELLFPAKGNPNAVISGFSRAKIRIDEASGVAGWTLHDLRRTTATYLAKLDTQPHVIERILNHVSGSFAGVAGVYNRHPYLDEMREALERWGAYLTEQGLA